MKEIIAWEEAKKKMEKHGVTYELHSDQIRLKNKFGASLGSMYSAVEIVNYMYGYESGKMDARLEAKIEIDTPKGEY